MTYAPFSGKLLAKLVESLSFKNIPTGTKTHRLKDGTIVRLYVNHEETTIEITSPFIGGDELKIITSCQCNEFFSEGVVVGIDTVVGYISPVGKLYTVDVCQDGNTQITVENCVTQGFEELEIGARVWCCLTIREVLAVSPAEISYVHPALPEYNPKEFGFAQTWGGMGAEMQYTSVLILDDPDGTYEELSDDAKLPNGTGIDIEPDDYPVSRPPMCIIGEASPVYNYWLAYDRFSGYEDSGVKTYATMDTKYNMEVRIGSTPTPIIIDEITINPEVETPSFEFNLQIFAML